MVARRYVAALAALWMAVGLAAAQEPSSRGTLDGQVRVAPKRTTPVGLPQDAGPHDESTIEWWYFNAFLTAGSGKRYAVVGSFFRTGIGGKKGHYLIYALADLDKKTKTAYSVLDDANRTLLQAFLPLASLQRPDDPRPMQLLALLQKRRLPAPHRLLPGNASLAREPFRIAFGPNALAQVTDDARTWKANLRGADFRLSLTLTQPSRPAMLVGGEGRTGLVRPDDMYYLSLTRMQASGTLTRGGKTETVSGDGWLDRQWGSSWVVQDNGWDWFGLQLSDGSDLIVYRIRDNQTGKILRAEATLLDKDGRQVVDTAPVFAASNHWTDPATKIRYPQAWTIRLPKTGHVLRVAPMFAAQTIPILGIGDAIWEGVVNVAGRSGNGRTVGGRGYMELVGYRVKPASKSAGKGGAKALRQD